MENKKGKSLIKKGRKLDREIILLVIIGLIIVLVDQIFKIGVQKIDENDIIPGILKFRVSQDTSAAYGVGTESTAMYIATNLIVLGVIFKFITTQSEFVDRKLKIFLSFILAGGISNIIDRATKGFIIEFIDFEQVCGLPIFNIADIFVLIGWMGVAAIFAAFTVKEWRNKKFEKELKDEDKK